MNPSYQSETLRVYVDGRWFSQKEQGVVTYLRDLHSAVVRIEGNRGKRIQFVFGVESLAVVTDDLRKLDCDWVEIGYRSLLWRWMCYPFWLKRQKFRIAIFQYVCPLFRLKTKYVVVMHDVLFLRIPRYFKWAYILPRAVTFAISSHVAHRVMTVSDQSTTDVLRYFRRKEGVVKVQCGAPYWEIGPNNELPSHFYLGERQYILTVGRIENRKNFSRLAQAFQGSELPAKGAKLVICGFCPTGGERIVEEIKKCPDVIWLDRVSDEELRSLYMNARAFVFPSFGEGFGIPVIEAMQVGIPIALSTAYPLSDVLNAADATFDPASEVMMREALLKVWNINAQTNQNATKKVIDTYNWESSAKIYLDLLSELDLAD